MARFIGRKILIVTGLLTLFLFLSSPCFASAEKEPEPVWLQDAYFQQGHPRLLFGSREKTALVQKMQVNTNVWAPVIRRAAAVMNPPPSPEQIQKGRNYTDSELMLSGALVYFLTGAEKYKTAVLSWMRAYSAETVWGSGWRANIDIPCNWYMYYMSLAYDILYDDMTEEGRRAVRESLTAHANAVYDAWIHEYQAAPYEQNHTYVPMVALGAAALALYGEVPDAERWLALANEVLKRGRRVLTTDGYYYEGTAYWEYAFHWHMKWADLMQRATGRDLSDLPILRENYFQVLHMSLPDYPFFFDVGDTEKGAQGREHPKAIDLGRKHMIFWMASVFKDPDIQGVADMMTQRFGFSSDEPAAQFLWYTPCLSGTPVSEQTPFHCFDDMGIVVWRSSWGEDATVCIFKAGPPLGYSAQAAMAELPGWTPNTGHVHPDMGAGWLFGRGAYLITDTGYTAKKQTQDHSTFLVDGRGTGADGTYWAYRTGATDRDHYEKWAGVKLVKVHLEKNYGYAMGDISSAYPDDLGPLILRRHVVMTRDFVVLVDEIGGEQPHTFTSLLHADKEFKAVSTNCYETVVGDSRLVVYMLAPEVSVIKNNPSIVFGGTDPAGGGEQQRGYQLSIQTGYPLLHGYFVTVLVPQNQADVFPHDVRLVRLDRDDASISIDWGGRKETVSLNFGWDQSVLGGPVSISIATEQN